MKRSLAFMLLLVCAAAATARADEVDDYVKAEMARRRIPGVAIAVVKEGRVIKQAAYGVASLELNVPVTTDTVFQIASTTKSFTATAVMMLVEEGKLSLDSPITKLLPDLPPAWGEVTVRHCLTHTSGLPDVVDDKTELPIAQTREAAFKIISSKPLVSKPGEKWSYNQTGYVILGMIIEKLSGKSFVEFLNDRIFRPLAMTSTSVADYHEVVPGRASAYTHYDTSTGDFVLSKDKTWSVQYLYPSFMYTCAGINTTVGDMAKWDAAIYSGKVLRPESFEQMWKSVMLNDGKPFKFRQTFGYGMGWMINELPGHRWVGHSGGAAASYHRYLDDRLTVIVLTNLQGSDPDGLVEGVAGFYIADLKKK